MKEYRLIRYDLCRSLTSQHFYWLAVPLFLIGGFTFTVQIMGDCLTKYPNIVASIGDVLVNCFAGSEGTGEFKLPMLWISILLGSSLSVLGYAEHFTGYGQQIFLRSKKRAGWWVAKCIWNIVITVLYFLIGILILTAFAALKGWNLSYVCTDRIFCCIFPNAPDATSVSQIPVVKLLVMILMGCIAWNLFQMYLSMYVKSFVSMIITIVMLLFSSYSNSPFLPGNYMMIARSQYITGLNEGIKVGKGCIIFVILIFISVLGGIIKISKCDYLVEEE